MSLRTLIEGAGLSLSACADILGVDHELFEQWADSKREMPPFYTSILAATLGFHPESLTSKTLAAARGANPIEPAAIWFKFRGDEFSDADRESILLVRRLGHNANQLEQSVKGQINRSWTTIFQDVLREVDLQASPRDQANQAAKVFSELNQFGHAGKGSAEILRDRLRSKGILLIESPIPNSQIEGCSFRVGDSSSQRPCIFVNTYKTTWFRRNVIIMHELGHALFDYTSSVEVDITSQSENKYSGKESLKEVRAETFARESLLSKRLLMSLCIRNGFQPNKLTPEALAVLVAESGVEKKTLVEILFDNLLIDQALVDSYLSFDISQLLREVSDHALTTKEYIDKIGRKAAAEWENKRFTSLSRRKLLLPVPYVASVLEAVKSFSISVSRAADLLMIDEATFAQRFPQVFEEVMA